MNHSQPATAQLKQLDVEQLHSLVAQVSNPDTARVVVDFFEAHPHLRERYSALYLAARKELIVNPIEAAAFAVGRAIRGFVGGVIAKLPRPNTAPKQALAWPTLFVDEQPGR
jgi:hypothetical protein